MNSRHIAFIGIAATSLLATLAGCSASDTSTPVKNKDAGSSGTAGAGSTTTGAAGDGTATGAGGMPIVMNPAGAGGAAGSVPVMCDPPPVTTKAQVADAMGVLANFEDPAAPGAVASVTPGGGWYSYTDSEVGAGLPAMFTPAPGAFAVEAPGNGGMGSALHVVGTGFAGGVASSTVWGAGAGVALGGANTGGIAGATNPPVLPTDLSMYTGISFFAKSAGMSDVVVQFGNPSTDPSYCTCTAAMLCFTGHAKVVAAIAADWTKYTVLFSELVQPTYVMAPVPFDPTSVLTINFASNGPVMTFDYWIDDITLVK